MGFVTRTLYLALLLCAGRADGVLIATGTANGTAPPDDPGWAHVGTRTGTNNAGTPLNGLTLIYLGNGWVMTAAHVKEADLRLGGQTYLRVPGSKLQLQNQDTSLADLIVFQVSGNPELPKLPILEIATVSPPVGAPVLMIGRGRNRGAADTWNQPPDREGFLWGAGASIRWGSNLVSDPSTGPDTGTDSIVFDFTKPGDPGFTSEEAQAVLGDSGGAVFHQGGGQWQLAGVLHRQVQYGGQPAAASYDGNLSYAADLARFRSQIIPLVRPQCSDEIDNDGDGNVDFPSDSQCSSAASNNEAAHLPSLSAFSLITLATSLALAGLVATRQRTPRRIASF